MENLNTYYQFNKEFLLVELARLLKGLIAPKIGIISLFLLILYASGLAHAGPLEQKLIDAAFRGKVEIARSLIDQGADVNAAGALEDTPLISASRKELPEIVRILLDAGVDPNFARSNGSAALMEACIFGHSEVVKLLVDAGAFGNRGSGRASAPGAFFVRTIAA